MNRRVLFFALAVLGLNVAHDTRAAIIHESATLGATGRPVFGLSVSATQFLGSRFSVDSVVRVESVGGHLVGTPGNLFATIVSLSSPTALPSGSPFDMTTVATTLFDPLEPSNDILVPLSATLNPGHYALIFGAPIFEQPSEGAMPDNNIDIPGSASYFNWFGLGTPPRWVDHPEFTNLRFVVTGFVIPEPTSVALIGLGLSAACGLYRRNRLSPRVIDRPSNFIWEHC
jgi:hypothetical protein